MDEGGPLDVQPLFAVHRERSLFQTWVTRRILPVAGASLTVEVDSAVGTAVPSLNGFKALYR